MLIVSQEIENANPATVNLLTPASKMALRMRHVGTVAPLIESSTQNPRPFQPGEEAPLLSTRVGYPVAPLFVLW